MLQNATPLRKSAAWPPNISDEHVFCTAAATRNASLQILFKCPTPAILFGNAAEPSRFAHFWEGAQSLAPATRNDIWTSKSAPYPSVICTSKCASSHNGVHFFDISTSKCGPGMVCFVHFDFEMCFAPQRRALFRHLNFQKWSGAGVFCTFWLRNVLRATTACNFSSLIWPDGSAPAALASLLVDPPEPQIIGKTQCFATFLPFRASASSFFWRFLFSDLLSSTLLFSLTPPISAFHPSILSEVWLLNFLRSCSLMLAESVIVDLANWCCHSLSLLVWAITSRTRVNRLICYFAMCRQATGTPRFLDEVEVQCSLKEFEEHATFVPVLTWFFNSTHGMGQGKWAIGVRRDGQGPFLWVIVSFS